MVSAWVADEMWTVDLKDRRLNKRLSEVLSQLGGQPTAGIPAAQCPGTRLVCLADSEGDIYEVLAEGAAGERGVEWIARAGIVLHEMRSRGAAQDRSPRRQPWE